MTDVDTVYSLQAERLGYVRRGLRARIAEVDAAIRTLGFVPGVEVDTDAPQEAPAPAPVEAAVVAPPETAVPVKAKARTPRTPRAAKAKK